MKQNIIIDANNLYVQGLIKVINQFMLEEAIGCSFTERRLGANIERLRKVFGDERQRMTMSSNIPVFSTPSLDKYNLVLKAN